MLPAGIDGYFAGQKSAAVLKTVNTRLPM